MEFSVFLYRSAVRLCIRAHTCFPDSEMFASLSTLTAETLMNTLGLIFKGEAIKHSIWCFSTSVLVFYKERTLNERKSGYIKIIFLMFLLDCLRICSEFLSVEIITNDLS